MKGLKNYVLMFALGSIVFIGFGDYIQAHNGPQEPKMSDIEEFVLIRIHFMGLFFAVIGIAGLVKFSIECDRKYKYTHKTHRDQKQES